MTRLVTNLDKGNAALRGFMKDHELSFYDRLNQAEVTSALSLEQKGMGVHRQEEPEKMRRVKIVQVDWGWNLDHPIMPRNVVFGSPESEEIARTRSGITGPDYDSHHGTTCVATLCMNRNANPHYPLDEDEAKLWDLANFCEFILVPLRDPPTEKTPETKRRLLRSFGPTWGLPTNMTEKCCDAIESSEESEYANLANDIVDKVWKDFCFSDPIISALEEVKDLCDANVIEQGDVVVLSIQYDIADRIRRSDGTLLPVHLPIIQIPEIENLVHSLTNDKRISVVVPAGNSIFQLGQHKFGRLQGDYWGSPPGESKIPAVDRWDESRLYANNGVSCGAILVGAETADDSRRLTVNWGSAVDAFGRSKLTIPDPRTLSIGNDMYRHWQGSTISSMICAGAIATIQQIRIARAHVLRRSGLEDSRNLAPLKPYEARAHLRQWRCLDISNEPCRIDLSGHPPDVAAWIEGTSLLNWDPA